MTEYRIETSQGQPFREHPSYGVCFWAATPNTRFTNFQTALRRLQQDGPTPLNDAADKLNA